MIRRSLFLMAVFAISISGCAQVTIDSVGKLSFPGSGKFFHPKLNNQGTQLLLTAENYKGLLIYDLKTRELKIISEADGAGYSPLITSNGDDILYTANEYVENRLHIKIMAYHMTNGLNEQIKPPMREFSSLFQTGDQIIYKENGQLKTARIGSDSAASSGKIAAGIDNQKLMLYSGGLARELHPFENESYIWPSVSPDGKMISAYAMGRGAFICDPEGKLIREFGKVEAPVWVSGGFIAGMITQDDGHRITASEIVLVNVKTGDKKTISPPGITAMYPTVALSGSKLAFQTGEGDIYLLSYHITP